MAGLDMIYDPRGDIQDYIKKWIEHQKELDKEYR